MRHISITFFTLYFTAFGVSAATHLGAAGLVANEQREELRTTIEVELQIKDHDDYLFESYEALEEKIEFKCEDENPHMIVKSAKTETPYYFTKRDPQEILGGRAMSHAMSPSEACVNTLDNIMYHAGHFIESFGRPLKISFNYEMNMDEPKRMLSVVKMTYPKPKRDK